MILNVGLFCEDSSPSYEEPSANAWCYPCRAAGLPSCATSTAMHTALKLSSNMYHTPHEHLGIKNITINSYLCRPIGGVELLGDRMLRTSDAYYMCGPYFFLRLFFSQWLT